MFKYKMVKEMKPWCFQCDSQIHGNGSLMTPYACK